MKLYVLKENNKIIAWSTKKMSEDEIEIEITEEEYAQLNEISNDEPMPINGN